jgi:recombination protein RecA
MGRPKKIKTDAVATTTCKVTVSEIVENKKLDALKNLMKAINKERGDSTIKFASEETEPERISFGNEYLDRLTGGGIPHKRFSIIWGPKSAGKSSLCYNVVAEAQKQGKVCAYIDLERTFSPDWATKQGVDLNKLVLCSQYQNAEQAMDDFINITKNKVADLIILDSIQALSPKGEQETKKGKEKSLEDDTMALLARKLSQFFRIASHGVYMSNVAILLVGQARTNLGGFIAFDTLSGGHALAHWSSLTIYLGRGAKADAPTKKVKNTEGETVTVPIGFSTNFKIEKRKINSEPEGTVLQLPFYFATGFNKHV